MDTLQSIRAAFVDYTFNEEAADGPSPAQVFDYVSAILGSIADNRPQDVIGLLGVSTPEANSSDREWFPAGRGVEEPAQVGSGRDSHGDGGGNHQHDSGAGFDLGLGLLRGFASGGELDI